ncbi:MAG: hypothetical protein ACP5R2_12460 [Anaerolineae bacterium]
MDRLTLFDEKNTLMSWLVVALGISVFVVVITSAVSSFLPYGVDWHEAFRPAALALLSGRSPYDIDKFYNPPWGLLPLLPLALLPEGLGRGLLFAISLLSFAIVAHRLKASPPALLVFLLSPPVLHGLVNANIDWLAMLGFILPPQLGLPFVLIKPQVGIGMAIFWLAEAWREGRFRKVLQIFWPTLLLSTASVALYGLWPLHLQYVTDHSRNFNTSLWPLSIPVGLALSALSIYKRNHRYAMASAPFLSPHVVFHSYAGLLAALLPATRRVTMAAIALGILILLKVLGFPQW